MHAKPRGGDVTSDSEGNFGKKEKGKGDNKVLLLANTELRNIILNITG